MAQINWKTNIIIITKFVDTLKFVAKYVYLVKISRQLDKHLGSFTNNSTTIMR